MRLQEAFLDESEIARRTVTRPTPLRSISSFSDGIIVGLEPHHLLADLLLELVIERRHVRTVDTQRLQFAASPSLTDAADIVSHSFEYPNVC